MIPGLFLDLDGVLADMDGFYQHLFGTRPEREQHLAPHEIEAMWAPVQRYPGRFFFDMPLTVDALVLWNGARRLHPAPAILTGVPRATTIPSAEADKRAWVAKYLGADVPVFTCRAKDKRLHGKPGDVLVDDWPRFQRRWERMGGIFVLHTSAADSLARLAELFGPTP
jgi:hypothetical protein